MDETRIIHGNALDLPLDDESVDLVVTSPPYFSLRSYRDEGEHYEGQMGSEGTPQEFLEALWAVMDECWRVLKPTGSAWINLGDSYAGSGGYNNTAIGAGGRGPASYKKAKWGASHDGAPAEWTKANAAWLAAIIDGEGSISGRIFKNSSGGESFVTWMRVGMMDPEVVHRIFEITGVGRVFQDKRRVWNWHVASQAARYVLERIWPFLLIKQKQALAAIELCKHVEHRQARGSWSPLTHDDLAYRAELVQAIRDWNKRRSNPLEPPRPAPLSLPNHAQWMVQPKSLNGLPWAFALGCINPGLYRFGAEGRRWILRAEVVWQKVNSLPESVTDRVRRSHEQWFHLTKQGRYFSAVDEVREAHSEPWRISDRPEGGGHRRGGIANNGFGLEGDRNRVYNPLGKLPGSVWTIPSEPLVIPDAVRQHYNLPDHFAAFPQEWPRRIILGWSPSGICVECGEGRRPVVERDFTVTRGNANGQTARDLRGEGLGAEYSHSLGAYGRYEATITGYACACPEPTADTTPARVLDPFCGTGTVPLVARALGRTGIGVDLSKDYCRLAEWRVFHSGAGEKAERRTWAERQLGLL